MATKKANTSSKPKLSVSAKIDRMIEREDATVKAYASVNIGGAFVIKDIAVVDGQKGMFARMPFRSYKMKQDRVLTTPLSALTVKLWRNPRTNYPMRTKVRHKVCNFFSKLFDFAGLLRVFRYCVSRGDHDDETENARSPPCRTDDTRPCGM